MRDTCEARNDYAEGYTTCQEAEGGLGWFRMRPQEFHDLEDIFLDIMTNTLFDSALRFRAGKRAVTVQESAYRNSSNRDLDHSNFLKHTDLVHQTAPQESLRRIHSD